MRFARYGRFRRVSGNHAVRYGKRDPFGPGFPAVRGDRDSSHVTVFVAPVGGQGQGAVRNRRGSVATGWTPAIRGDLLYL